MCSTAIRLSEAKQNHLITDRALHQRINRRLRARGGDLIVAASRGAHEKSQLGRYFLANVRLGKVVRKNVDLMNLGCELNVLKPWERQPQGEDERVADDRLDKSSLVHLWQEISNRRNAIRATREDPQAADAVARTDLIALIDWIEDELWNLAL